MQATKATRSKDVAANSVGAMPHSQASGATNPAPIAAPTNSNERMEVTGVSDKPALALVKPAERTRGWHARGQGACGDVRLEKLPVQDGFGIAANQGRPAGYAWQAFLRVYVCYSPMSSSATALTWSDMVWVRGSVGLRQMR